MSVASNSLAIVMPEAVQNLGRFQVLNHNQLIAPGKCAGCGGFTDRHFIDFGLELDFYGVVYLCLETCFTEVANQIGFISPKQAEILKNQVRVSNEAGAILLTKLEALENVSDAMASYLRINPHLASSSGDSGTVHQSSSTEGAKAEGSPDPGSQGGQSTPDGGEQRTPEPSNESGSQHIRNDDGVDEFARQFGI